MPNKKMSFSQFCAELGLPLRNVRHSWCAVNREKKLAVFTIWDNQIDHENDSYELWNNKTDQQRLLEPDGRKTVGLRELKSVLDKCLENDYRVIGVRCVPNYPLTVPRKRKSYFDNELLAIQLIRTPNGVTGKFQATIGVDAFMRGKSVIHSMELSAIDDIDTDTVKNDDPEYRLRMAGNYVRDTKVRKQVLKRANGVCEECNQPGFIKSDGSTYLETHHVISLREQGSDQPHNVIALCATDHRRAHYASDWAKLQDKFLAKLSKYTTVA